MIVLIILIGLLGVSLLGGFLIVDVLNNYIGYIKGGK